MYFSKQYLKGVNRLKHTNMRPVKHMHFRKFNFEHVVSSLFIVLTTGIWRSAAQLHRDDKSACITDVSNYCPLPRVTVRSCFVCKVIRDL